jgi:hypothetical protein
MFILIDTFSHVVCSFMPTDPWLPLYMIYEQHRANSTEMNTTVCKPTVLKGITDIT